MTNLQQTELGETTITPMIKEGINPGTMENQPFKQTLIMKNLFHYCVYRIASAYKKTMMQGYICQGYFLMFVAFTFYALALAECALSIFDLKINRTLIIVFCIPAIIGLLFFEKLFPNQPI